MKTKVVEENVSFLNPVILAILKWAEIKKIESREKSI